MNTIASNAMHILEEAEKLLPAAKKKQGLLKAGVANVGETSKSKPDFKSTQLKNLIPFLHASPQNTFVLFN